MQRQCENTKVKTKFGEMRLGVIINSSGKTVLRVKEALERERREVQLSLSADDTNWLNPSFKYTLCP